MIIMKAFRACSANTVHSRFELWVVNDIWITGPRRVFCFHSGVKYVYAGVSSYLCKVFTFVFLDNVQMCKAKLALHFENMCVLRGWLDAPHDQQAVVWLDPCPGFTGHKVPSCIL